MEDFFQLVETFSDDATTLTSVNFSGAFDTLLQVKVVKFLVMEPLFMVLRTSSHQQP